MGNLSTLQTISAFFYCSQLICFIVIARQKILVPPYILILFNYPQNNMF